MKNNFSINFHFTLDLDDSSDLYLYDYLLYLADLSPVSSKSDIIKQILRFSALRDIDFMSFDEFLDKFFDNSEVMK